MDKSKWLQWGLVFVISITMSMANAQPSMRESNYLTNQEKGLIRISAHTATGDIDQLKKQMNEGLDAGLTINEVNEALIQLYTYCGLPKSLRAIRVFMEVQQERRANGMEDMEGKTAALANNVSDKYEKAQRALEELIKTSHSTPAPSVGDVVSRVDAFLKEKFFANFFSSEVLTCQQREFVTIAALASMSGGQEELESHINRSKNVNITQEKLIEIAELIEDNVNITQANTLRKLIDVPLVAVIKPDMIVRISEIEIYPTFLDEYKAILKDEAAASVAKEPGVIAIFPMYQEEDHTQVRIVEIYADKEAYQSHLKTPHFQYYKAATLPMVKALKLWDMTDIDKNTMGDIFKKLK